MSDLSIDKDIKILRGVENCMFPLENEAVVLDTALRGVCAYGDARNINIYV